MAIAFARVNIHSRSHGHSAVAGAAYRAAKRLLDARTGITHDYTKRSDVKYQSVLLPDDADAKFKDRQTLWNAVEKAEKRKDSQVAKDIQLALPKELDLEKQIDLARRFAQDHFVKHGLAADIAIHDHGDGNPHAHLYITTRRILGAEIDKKKARDLNPSFSSNGSGQRRVAEDERWGKAWRDVQNNYFTENVIPLQVDSEHLVKQRHAGRHHENSDNVHYLHEDNQARRELSVSLAVNDPLSVLNELSQHQATFTKNDVARVVNKNTETAAQAEAALNAVMTNQDLRSLGLGEDGREHFTSIANFSREAALGDSVTALLHQSKTRLSHRGVTQAIKTYTLNDEQARVLRMLAEGRGVSAIVGRAGTGKSYLMKAANAVWEKNECRVFGMAISAVAAHGLESDSGISSRTIAYYRNLLRRDKWALQENDIVVMDEAGMTDLNDMCDIVRHVKQSGAKLVLLGDPDQLQPIGPGAPFRAILERSGFDEMDKIMRQYDTADSLATGALARGDVKAALAHYDGKGAVTLADSEDAARADLIAAWSEVATHDGALASSLILAHQNKDVGTLNLAARQVLKDGGQLGANEHFLKTEQGKLPICSGERLVFLRNNRALGVSNGNFGTVMSVTPEGFRIRLDGSSQPIDIDPNDYGHFAHGYAATTHKSQGATREHVFVYASQYFDRYLSYVALSRHRDTLKVFASKTLAASTESLGALMGRDVMHDNVLDYPLQFASRRGVAPDTLVGKAANHLTNAKLCIKNAWHFVFNHSQYCKTISNQNKQALSQAARQDAVIVAELTDRYRDIGALWGKCTKLLENGTLTEEALLETPEYLDMLEKMERREALAAKIAADLPRYQRALDFNRLSAKAVTKLATKHAINQSVSNLLTAHQSGNSLALQRLSREVMADVPLYYTSLNRACQRRGIDIRVLLRETKHAAQIGQYYLARQGTTSKAQTHSLKAAYRYAMLNRKISTRWQAVYACGGTERFSATQLAAYQKDAILRDDLAAEVIASYKEGQEGLSIFQLDESAVSQAAQRHAKRSTVVRYQTADGPTRQKEALASDIMGDKSFYRYVYEQGVDWDGLRKAHHAHQHKEKLLTLSPDKRAAYQQFRDYQAARIAAGKTWSSLIKDKEAGQTIEATRTAMAWSLTRERNRLAYGLIREPERFAEHIRTAHIKPAAIEKQSTAHHGQLHYLASIRKDQSTAPPIRYVISPKTAVTPDNKNTTPRYDAEAVSQALIHMGADFYTQVIGVTPKPEGGNHYRYGSGHAITVAHRGSRAGAWYSFASGQGGGPLQLLMDSIHGYGLSFVEALKEGAQIAGISPMEPNQPKRVAPAAIKAAPSLETEAEAKAKRIQAARYYYDSAQPIGGTLGERYLREHRKITGDISAVKFHPRIRDTIYNKQTGEKTVSYHPGIVFAAKNATGEITAAQTILLDSETGNKVDPTQVGVVKRSRGVVQGSAVCVQTGRSNQVVLAEGLETGHSLTTALPDANIYVTLGNIKNAEHLSWLAKKHQATSIDFAADNDTHNGHQNLKAIRTIADTFKAEYQLDTRIATPDIGGNQKCDFNDVLQLKGPVAVTTQLSQWKTITIKPKEPALSDHALQANLQVLFAGYHKDTTERQKETKPVPAKPPAKAPMTPEQFVDKYFELDKLHDKAKPSDKKTELGQLLDKMAMYIHKNSQARMYAYQRSSNISANISYRARKALGREQGFEHEL